MDTSQFSAASGSLTPLAPPHWWRLCVARDRQAAEVDGHDVLARCTSRTSVSSSRFFTRALHAAVCPGKAASWHSLLQ